MVSCMLLLAFLIHISDYYKCYLLEIVNGELNKKSRRRWGGRLVTSAALADQLALSGSEQEDMAVSQY